MRATVRRRVVVLGIGVLGLLAACSSNEVAPGAASTDAGFVEPEVDAGADAVAACADGQQRCGEACVDVSVSPENCGACGNVCSDATVCNQGICTSSCDEGWRECDRSCVYTATDPAHCGSCGHACGSGEGCFSGECKCRRAGFVNCGGTCSDPKTDRLNCGACGNTCAGDCFDGQCISETLVSGRADPDDLTANDTDLFWFDRGDGRIERCPIGSCSEATAVTLETLPGVQALAAAGRYVFWGNSETLRRYDATTQSITTVATPTLVAAITADDAHVFWRDAAQGKVFSCAIDGDCTAGATTIAEGLPAANSTPSEFFRPPMLVADGQIYFGFAKSRLPSVPGYSPLPECGIHVCPTSGCSSIPPPFFYRRPGPSITFLQSLGAAQGRLYWTVSNIEYPTSDIVERYSCPLTGCNGEPMELRDVDDFGAAEGDRVYWVEATPESSAVAQHHLHSCEVGETVEPDNRTVVECKTPRAQLLSGVSSTASRPRHDVVVRQGFAYFTEPGGTVRRGEVR